MSAAATGQAGHSTPAQDTPPASPLVLITTRRFPGNHGIKTALWARARGSRGQALPQEPATAPLIVAWYILHLAEDSRPGRSRTPIITSAGTRRRPDGPRADDLAAQPAASAD